MMTMVDCGSYGAGAGDCSPHGTGWGCGHANGDGDEGSGNAYGERYGWISIENDLNGLGIGAVSGGGLNANEGRGDGEHGTETCEFSQFDCSVSDYVFV